MKSILLLTAAIEALARGAEMISVLDDLARVGRRMAEDGAPEPTDEELNLVRGRLLARQARIDGVK